MRTRGAGFSVAFHKHFIYMMVCSLHSKANNIIEEKCMCFCNVMLFSHCDKQRSAKHSEYQPPLLEGHNTPDKMHTNRFPILNAFLRILSLATRLAYFHLT